MFEDFLKSKVSIIIISILWGLGLSTLFKRACHGHNCKLVVYHGPSPASIDGVYHNYGTSDCYQYKPYITSCN